MVKEPAVIVRELDQWAKGLFCGVIVGLSLAVGFFWAAAEPLK